jgi:hypothetical protein
MFQESATGFKVKNHANSLANHHLPCAVWLCACSLNRAYTTADESPEPTFTDVLTIPCTGSGKALECVCRILFFFRHYNNLVCMIHMSAEGVLTVTCRLCLLVHVCSALLLDMLVLCTSGERCHAVGTAAASVAKFRLSDTPSCAADAADAADAAFNC